MLGFIKKLVIGASILLIAIIIFFCSAMFNWSNLLMSVVFLLIGILLKICLPKKFYDDFQATGKDLLNWISVLVFIIPGLFFLLIGFGNKCEEIAFIPCVLGPTLLTIGMFNIFKLIRNK